MAIKVGQMRYVGDGDARNYPTNLTAAMLTSGAMFENSIRISELSISADFGIKFYLNDTPSPLSTRNNTIANKEIRGTWTLPTGKDKVNNMPIYSVRFDAASLKQFLDNNKLLTTPQYLFIDYVYETTV